MTSDSALAAIFGARTVSRKGREGAERGARVQGV